VRGDGIAVFMAGWSSRNKYSLLGAMRAIASMISYEFAGAFDNSGGDVDGNFVRLPALSTSKRRFVHGIASWNLFTPWGLAGAALFLVAATAESNRTPFDIPEAESEIIAGYLTEYSGFKYALFFLGEYLGLFALSSLGVTLFLGGWSAPFAFLDWFPSWGWFFLKLFAMIAFFIWTRGPSATAQRSIIALFVEVHAADVPGEFICRRTLAIFRDLADSRRSAAALDCLPCVDRPALRYPGRSAGTERPQAGLPLRQLMHWSFYIVAVLTIGSAITAMSLRNIVHCGLVLTVTFAGLALLYLQLNAQFVALAQILIYIGAVAILIVFAVLLTRSSETTRETSRPLSGIVSGVVIALAAFATLARAITSSAVIRQTSAAAQPASVRQIGQELMKNYIIPLEIVALLLTAALIGAAVIALQERRRSE